MAKAPTPSPAPARAKGLHEEAWVSLSSPFGWMAVSGELGPRRPEGASIKHQLCARAWCQLGEWENNMQEGYTWLSFICQLCALEGTLPSDALVTGVDFFSVPGMCPSPA